MISICHYICALHIAKPYEFEPGQIGELACVCVSLAGAHNEVFTAASYQLQEG